MITLLSRILSYMNGTLFNDAYYKFCSFIITHYIDMEYITIEQVMEECQITKEDILGFCKLLGYSSFETFNAYLMQSHAMRLDQIRARMIDLNSDAFIEAMDNNYTHEEMKEKISNICKDIFECKRIVLFGAQYPMAIAVEMQTDFISLGKPCFQHHSYAPIELDENDVAIVISGTGRYIQDFNKQKQECHLERARSVLITQNPIYINTAFCPAKHSIVVKGKYDGINFNYQLMVIFDLLRFFYYQQYYL